MNGLRYRHVFVSECFLAAPQACVEAASKWVTTASDCVSDADVFASEALKGSVSPRTFTSYLLGFDDPATGKCVNHLLQSSA